MSRTTKCTRVRLQSQYLQLTALCIVGEGITTRSSFYSNRPCRLKKRRIVSSRKKSYLPRLSNLCSKWHSKCHRQKTGQAQNRLPIRKREFILQTFRVRRTGNHEALTLTDGLPCLTRRRKTKVTIRVIIVSMQHLKSRPSTLQANLLILTVRKRAACLKATPNRAIVVPKSNSKQTFLKPKNNQANLNTETKSATPSWCPS